MPDKTMENTTDTSGVSCSQPNMNAVISRFESYADAIEAIEALKQAGFSDEVISVCDFDNLNRREKELQAETSTITMVSVQAEGERAAEAWSVLEEIRMQLSVKN